VLRFCLKVGDQLANDMVLGTSKYKQGIKATLFRRRDRGIGYLAGEGDDPQIVRTYFVNTPMAEQIVTRARALREAAGTITGHAAGAAPLTVDVDPAAGLLDDLADMFDRIPFTNDKVWGEELLALLAERKPAAYGAWDTETLTGALKPHGVRSRQVLRRIDGKPTNKQGYDREALAEAVTKSHRFASVD
jgi:S-DNA-T family DNA segregation ATPase FtsK/SpoIIIE